MAPNVLSGASTGKSTGNVGLIDTIRGWAPAYRAGGNRSRSQARESAWGTSSAAWPPATLAGSHWQSVPADSTFWFLGDRHVRELAVELQLVHPSLDGVADAPAAGIAGRVARGDGGSQDAGWGSGWPEVLLGSSPTIMR